MSKKSPEDIVNTMFAEPDLKVLSDTHLTRSTALSAALKGRKLSEDTREKLRQANLGRKHTAVSREKQSKASLGRKHTDASREKIRQAHIGIKPSLEVKEKLSNMRKGHKLSETTKAKMRAAHIGREIPAGALQGLKKAVEAAREVKLKASKENQPCPKCGQAIHPSRLEAHMKTMSCVYNTGVQDRKSIQCPHCLKFNTGGRFMSLHFANCKQKEVST